MEFWIQQGNNKLQLPVKPTEYTVTVASNNTVVNVIRLGDINLKGNTGLREVSINSFFPAKPYNFISTGEVTPPLTCVETLESWRNADSPVRLIITGVLNMECTIEAFNYGERDATGDFYYSIALKEYKKPQVQGTGSGYGETSTRTTQPEDTNSGKTYVVKKGDCLWKISKQFYGKGSEYPKIYDANRNIISNPDKIYVGQVLIIP